MSHDAVTFIFWMPLKVPHFLEAGWILFNVECFSKTSLANVLKTVYWYQIFKEFKIKMLQVYWFPSGAPCLFLKTFGIWEYMQKRVLFYDDQCQFHKPCSLIANISILEPMCGIYLSRLYNTYMLIELQMFFSRDLNCEIPPHRRDQVWLSHTHTHTRITWWIYAHTPPT